MWERRWKWKWKWARGCSLQAEAETAGRIPYHGLSIQPARTTDLPRRFAGWLDRLSQSEAMFGNNCMRCSHGDARPAGLLDEAAIDMWQGSEKESDKVQSKKKKIETR